MPYDVFKGTDTPIIVGVSGFNMGGVTRITCVLHPSGVTVDTDVTPAAITWTDTELTFNLNDLDCSGIQRGKVLIFDPEHSQGQVLSHPELEGHLQFRFLN